MLGVHSDDTGERLDRYMSYISGNDQSGWAISFVHGNSLGHLHDGFDVTGNSRIRIDVSLYNDSWLALVLVFWYVVCISRVMICTGRPTRHILLAFYVLAVATLSS